MRRYRRTQHRPDTLSLGQHAFTLIELLVVIAILSILAAILFPVFSAARAKARQVSCISNSRQIGQSLLMYAQDFDERYPMAFFGFSASRTTTGWPTLAQPYIKNTQIFVCPDAMQSTGFPPGSRFPVTYAYNYYIGGNNNPTTGIMNSPLAGINKPAQTVMLVDSGTNPREGVRPEAWPLHLHATNRHTPWLLVHSGSNLLSPTNPLANYGGPHARHAETVNVAWADGHVKAAKIESFYVLPGREVPGRPSDRARYWSPCLDPEYGCP